MLSYFILAKAAESPDSAIRVTLITTVGVVLTALITYFSTRYAARKSSKASTEATKVTERQVDVGEWQALLEQVKGEATRLVGRVDDLEERDENRRERIDSLESTVSVNKGRITDLERSAAEQQVKYGAAVQYIRDLMAWAISFISDENKPPSPPPSIAEDLK